MFMLPSEVLWVAGSDIGLVDVQTTADSFWLDHALGRNTQQVPGWRVYPVSAGDSIEFRIASPQSLASRGRTACGGSARAAARADLKQANFIHRARARESPDSPCSFTAHLSCIISFIFRRAYLPLCSSSTSTILTFVQAEPVFAM